MTYNFKKSNILCVFMSVLKNFKRSDLLITFGLKAQFGKWQTGLQGNMIVGFQMQKVF